MVKVHAVRPAVSGFGMYEVVPDGAACYEADTAAEYVKYVLAASDEYEAVTPGHEGWPQVLDAEGKVQGQSGGTLLGWASPGGRVDLEVVYEVPRGVPGDPMLLLDPAYHDHPDAREFAQLLADTLPPMAADLDCSAWETDIPPRDQWEREVENLARHLETL